MIKRIKKSLTAIPASVAEAAQYLLSIGEKQREINAIKRDTKAKIDTLNKESNEKILGLKKDRDNFFVALFAYAQPRKKSLTSNRRSVPTIAGTFGWRFTPPAVLLQEGKTDQDIIKTLKRMGLSDYVRVVEEVDREALLRDRPTVPGVSYTQIDEFFAKPKMKKGEGRAEELVKITEAIDT